MTAHVSIGNGRVLSTTQSLDAVRHMYAVLWKAWGPQGWWPARTRFAVMLGAILTQHTAWSHVAQVIVLMQRDGLLSPAGVRSLSHAELEDRLRRTGCYRQKARYVTALLAWLECWGDNLTRALGRSTDVVRDELLALAGIGPETADAILLYAGRHAVCVVDTYTIRILSRHGIVPTDAAYADVQRLIHRAITPAHETYNELHALLVHTGKTFCKTQPQCSGCPLDHMPHTGGIWPRKKQQNAAVKHSSLHAHSAKNA
jgi:endonuclease III related protein